MTHIGRYHPNIAAAEVEAISLITVFSGSAQRSPRAPSGALPYVAFTELRSPVRYRVGVGLGAVEMCIRDRYMATMRW